VSEESLIVKLKGDTADLDKKLDKANKGLNELNENSSKSDRSLAKLGSASKVAGGAVLELSKAAIAVGTALTTMITLTAKGEQELQALSRQAKLSTGDFEALAFATKQYGINAEQVADISKDISDKLGEFASTGTGAFQDFADVTGKTTEEAQALAAEWQNLSSQQVIQEIANQLEEAGASANETTFVFESLGNDLSRLAPLFADNGKELEQLTRRYNDVNAALSITQKEAKGLTDAATSFDLLTESIGNGTKLISAQLAPALDEFFNSVIDVVPDATQAILDFINSFKDTENITNEQSLINQIEDQKNAIKGLQGQIVANQNVIDNYYGNTDKYVEKQKRLNEELKQEKKELEDIERQLKKVQEEKEANATSQDQSGGTISASLGQSSSPSDELQSLIDRFKTEEQLLLEKYENERTIAAGNKELLLELEREYQENLKSIRDEARLADLEADQAAFDAMNELRESSIRAERDRVNENKKANRDKEKAERAYADVAIQASGLIFEDNKKAQYANALINTAEGVTEALPNYPLAAAVAASGALQLATISSASKGGSGSVSAPTDPALQEEAPTLEAQNTDADGSNQTFTFKFEENGSLGEVAELLNRILVTGKQDGVI